MKTSTANGITPSPHHHTNLLKRLISDRPLDRDGVAVIGVHGQLVSRSSWLSTALGFASYDELRGALAAAAADPAVKGVVLDIDSPGGDLAGAVETAAAVRAVQARKPVVAYVDSLAASAAYVVAAGAGLIVATPSSTLGSLGVVVVHMDRSAALEKRGVRATVLHAGAYKTDGHSLAPLAPDARQRIEGIISQAHDLLLESVGRHRPSLGAAGARKTEAAIYLGQKAVDAGLADEIGDMRTAVKAAATLRASAPVAAMLPSNAVRPNSMTTERTKMTTPSHNPALASPAPPPVAPAHKLTSAEQGRLAFAQAAGLSPVPMSAEMAAGRAAFSAASK